MRGVFIDRLPLFDHCARVAGLASRLNSRKNDLGLVSVDMYNPAAGAIPFGSGADRIAPGIDLQTQVLDLMTSQLVGIAELPLQMDPSRFME